MIYVKGYAILDPQYTHPKSAYLLLGLLGLGQGGRLVERVAGDGEEHVEEGVVAEEGEHHEVEAVDVSVGLAPALGVDGRVHDLVPVLAREDLEDGEQRGDDGVEVGGGPPVGKVEAAAEELHPEEGEDEYEEGEEQEEREDGADGVHERDHQVAEVRPILGDLEHPGT